MSEAARFVVIQRKRGVRDPMVLAKALAAARNTPVQDQAIVAQVPQGPYEVTHGEDGCGLVLNADGRLWAWITAGPAFWYAVFALVY